MNSCFADELRLIFPFAARVADGEYEDRCLPGVTCLAEDEERRVLVLEETLLDLCWPPAGCE